ncbi:MAG: galactokinase [Sphingobacteriales bacterium]|nr:galactokinase [Sphingobacteriales bacterium]
MEKAIPALGEHIKSNSIIVRSPGRINLIGEHTDYNDGFVLPAAIDKAAYISLTPREDNEIHLYSIDLKDNYKTSLSDIHSLKEPNWPNYLLGVVAQFIKAGIKINGFDAALTADIPIGAGLSSSAAVECAMAFALNEYTKTGFDKLTLVKMAQKAEHEYAGVKCGIMDQFASVFGKKNHVVRLDCRSLQYEYEPFDISGYKIVLLDTNVKHSLASSEYNVRRQQCEAGVVLIQPHHPEVKSLRDATVEMLDKYVQPVDELIYQRCKYVIEENNRLLGACADLKKGDLKSFVKKMFATHDGLSRLYEVSCKELDFLADRVRDNENVLGARMMGGGFGGCTINIVKEEAVDSLIEQVGILYNKAMNKELKAYVAQIEEGTTILSSN